MVVSKPVMAARLRSPYSQVLPICFKASSHLPLYPKLLLALRIPSPQLPILLITQPLLLFSPLLSPCPLAISTAQFLNFSLFSCILALLYPSLSPLFSPTSLALARSSLLFFSLLWTIPDDCGWLLSLIHNKNLPSHGVAISAVS